MTMRMRTIITSIVMGLSLATPAIASPDVDYNLDRNGYPVKTPYTEYVNVVLSQLRDQNYQVVIAGMADRRQPVLNLRATLCQMSRTKTRSQILDIFTPESLPLAEAFVDANMVYGCDRSISK